VFVWAMIGERGLAENIVARARSLDAVSATDAQIVSTVPPTSQHCQQCRQNAGDDRTHGSKMLGADRCGRTGALPHPRLGYGRIGRR
jgi:hypothetical protein